MSDDQKEIKAVFDIIDKDKTGSLDISEFPYAIRALGLNPTESEIKEAFIGSDTNNDGMITYEEFLKLYNIVKLGNESAIQDVQEIYKLCVAEDSEHITADDLVKILTGIGEPLTKEEAEIIVRDFDVNRNGKIKLDNLIQGMLK
jgi:calmodulin